MSLFGKQSAAPGYLNRGTLNLSVHHTDDFLRSKYYLTSYFNNIKLYIFPLQNFE